MDIGLQILRLLGVRKFVTHTASTDLAAAYDSASPSCATPSRHLGHGAIGRLWLTPVGLFIRLGEKGKPNPSIRGISGFGFSNRIRVGEYGIRPMDVSDYRRNNTDLAGIGIPQLDDTEAALRVGSARSSSLAVQPKIHSYIDARLHHFGWVTASLGVRA